MSLDISVIILTYNEEIHIRRCIENVKPIVKQIFVVDSFSTDHTVSMAEELGAGVFQNKWQNNHAKQFNWALDHIPIQTKWVMRLDADEYLTEELKEELKRKLPGLDSDVSGIVFPLRRVFMGRHLRRAAGKVLLLRVFKHHIGRCESRWMDEHIQLNSGKTIVFENEFADDNLNNLTWWTAKHNQYSIREAIDLLDTELELFDRDNINEAIMGEQALAKRKKKLKYAKAPLFWRSFSYFLYRYFLKLGFIEGKEGFLWHFLQGWWYRTLVDAKIFEIKKNCGKDKEKIIDYIKTNYGIDCRNF
ncbi:MAG: glycosyltransferase family 2 protein [Bacteroidales bacterium]|jgi:glycosyltransferase involved in cell wall biosynthesis|nr:glycosyltransferase family 2 protein [Bacteroidales bacterium]